MKPFLCLLTGAVLCGLCHVSPLRAQDDKKDEPGKEDKKDDDKKKDKDKDKEDEDDDSISSASEASVQIDVLVGGREVWEFTADKIEKDYKKAGFKWTETGKKDRGLLRPKWLWMKSESTSGRFSISTAKSKYNLFGGAASAEEVNFDFKDGKLAGLTISVWNKGDSDDITESAFMKLITAITDQLNNKYKLRGKALGKDPNSASKAERVRWEHPDTLAQLEHSSSKELMMTRSGKRERIFQGEFIRLRLVPKGGRSLVGVDAAGSNAAKVGLGALVKNLTKKDNGDVYIGNLPMVDQGDKGYCAVASSERVMRYYGIQCDQHDLAQASESSGGGGTSPRSLEDALHKLQGRFKIHVRDLVKFEEREYTKMVKNYNREATKVGGKLWTDEDWFFKPNPDILREARARNGAYEKFQKMLLENTSKGVPLLWGLILGYYPENGEKTPQSGGGHMRAIIGYNAKTDEVIFSDSWGAGHELKRMKGRDAWAATTGLYLVVPQNR